MGAIRGHTPEKIQAGGYFSPSQLVRAIVGAASTYLPASSTGVLFRTSGPRCALLVSLPVQHLIVIRSRPEELSQRRLTLPKKRAVWRLHMLRRVQGSEFIRA